jgi:hypothetical protein
MWCVSFRKESYSILHLGVYYEVTLPVAVRVFADMCNIDLLESRAGLLYSEFNLDFIPPTDDYAESYREKNWAVIHYGGKDVRTR